MYVLNIDHVTSCCKLHGLYIKCGLSSLVLDSIRTSFLFSLVILLFPVQWLWWTQRTGRNHKASMWASLDPMGPWCHMRKWDSCVALCHCVFCSSLCPTFWWCREDTRSGCLFPHRWVPCSHRKPMHSAAFTETHTHLVISIVLKGLANSQT